MADGDALLIATNNSGTYATALTKSAGSPGYDFPALTVTNEGGDAAVAAFGNGKHAASAVGLKGTSPKGRGVDGRGATGVEALGSSLGVDASSSDGVALRARSRSGLAGQFVGPVVIV